MDQGLPPSTSTCRTACRARELGRSRDQTSGRGEGLTSHRPLLLTEGLPDQHVRETFPRTGVEVDEARAGQCTVQNQRDRRNKDTSKAEEWVVHASSNPALGSSPAEGSTEDYFSSSPSSSVAGFQSRRRRRRRDKCRDKELSISPQGCLNRDEGLKPPLDDAIEGGEGGKDLHLTLSVREKEEGSGEDEGKRGKRGGEAQETRPVGEKEMTGGEGEMEQEQATEEKEWAAARAAQKLMQERGPLRLLNSGSLCFANAGVQALAIILQSRPGLNLIRQLLRQSETSSIAAELKEVLVPEIEHEHERDAMQGAGVQRSGSCEALVRAVAESESFRWKGFNTENEHDALEFLTTLLESLSSEKGLSPPAEVLGPFLFGFPF